MPNESVTAASQKMACCFSLPSQYSDVEKFWSTGVILQQRSWWKEAA